MAWIPAILSFSVCENLSPTLRQDPLLTSILGEAPALLKNQSWTIYLGLRKEQI